MHQNILGQKKTFVNKVLLNTGIDFFFLPLHNFREAAE